MNAEFSEATFAFALTHNIINVFPDVYGLPVFPTTRAEGQLGGGFDVKIPRRTVPLYLQFKVPRVLQRTSKNRPTGFPLPYYRIYLRTREPNQHRLLSEHQRNGRLAYYAVPRFHTTESLAEAFDQTRVVHKTAMFRPLDVGPLDEEEHYIAYHTAGARDWRVFSKQSDRDSDFSFESLQSEVYGVLAETRPLPIAEVLAGVIQSLYQLEEFVPIPPIGMGEQGVSEADRVSGLLQGAVALTRIVLDAQLVLLSERLGDAPSGPAGDG